MSAGGWENIVDGKLAHNALRWSRVEECEPTRPPKVLVRRATGQSQDKASEGRSQGKKSSRSPLPYPPINQQYSNLLFTSRFTWNIPVDNGWRGCANWSYEVRESVQRMILLGLDSRETGQPRLATRRAKREVR